MTRIDIEPILDADGNQRHTVTGPRYRTLVNGEVICATTQRPVLDTCRLLCQRGVTGAFEAWHRWEGLPRMRGVVERAARVTVIENKKRGPLFARFEAMGDEQ